MSHTYAMATAGPDFKYNIVGIPAESKLTRVTYRSGDNDDRPEGTAIMIDHAWIRPRNGLGNHDVPSISYGQGRQSDEFGYDRTDCDYYLVTSSVGKQTTESYKVEPLPSVDETKEKHYPKLDPWKLQQEMESSGNAFVDARRADTIKYAFRMKGDKHKLLNDLKKARHCVDAAVKELEANI